MAERHLFYTTAAAINGTECMPFKDRSKARENWFTWGIGNGKTVEEKIDAWKRWQKEMWFCTEDEWGQRV